MEKKVKKTKFMANKSFSLRRFSYRIERFYDSNSGKVILSAISVGLGLLITYFIANYYLSEMSFTYWVEAIVTGITIVFILLALKSLFKGSNRVSRAITYIVLLFLFYNFIVPKFNIRNFADDGSPLKWMNTETGEVYNKPLMSVFKDKEGVEYFLHPETADTCRWATKENLFYFHDYHGARKAEYIQVYDTLYRKKFSKQGKYSSGICWGDVERGDIIQITNLNNKGLGFFHVSPDKSISVSSGNRNSSYSLQKEAPAGKEWYVYYINLSDGVEMELCQLRKVVRRVKY